MAARDPNSPRWATPTLRTTPTCGVTMSARNRMCPTPRAPISTTRKSVVSSARSTVSGTPISVLKEPMGATVSPEVSSSWASRSFVLVLPCEPVMPTTAVPVSSPATWRASAPSATTVSGTTTPGRPSGRSDSTAAAPARTAAAAKSWPSACTPGTATNNPPGSATRESTKAGAVTRVSPVPVASPSTTWAISAVVISIIRRSPRRRRCPGCPRLPPGRRTAAPGRRPLGPLRDPFPR